MGLAEGDDVGVRDTHPSVLLDRLPRFPPKIWLEILGPLHHLRLGGGGDVVLVLLRPESGLKVRRLEEELVSPFLGDPDLRSPLQLALELPHPLLALLEGEAELGELDDLLGALREDHRHLPEKHLDSVHVLSFGP